jgi:uncharacterized protein YndB with AHSA1/START domain
MSEQKVFTISRTLNAPRQLVWDVSTKDEHLQHWLGPKGSTTIHSTLDFRPGGFYHYCLSYPNGTEMWGKVNYVEITPIERIVQVQSFSNAEGDICPAPFEGKWPMKIHATISFTDLGNATEMTIVWHPFEASQEELDFFHSMHDSMNGGWSGTFDVLEEYLATLA